MISPRHGRPVHERYPNVRMLSLGQDAESGDHSRSGFRSGSKWASLFQSIRSCLSRLGEQLATLPVNRRTHLHRGGSMGQQSKNTAESGILLFSDLRQSLPQLPDSDSRTERQPYILGIQALETVRPSVGVAELELFLSGWFLADQWYARMMGSKCDKEIPLGGNSMPSVAVQQSTTHDLLSQLPSPGSREGSDALGRNCTKQNIESQQPLDLPAS